MAKNKNSATPYTGNRSPIASAVQPTPVQSQQVFAQQQVTTIFDPDVLKRYSEMVPDAPERVLRVFEQNSDAERKMREALVAHQQSAIDVQMHALNLQGGDNRRRDWMAFAIIVVGMITSAAFAYMDKIFLSGGTLVAIIAYAVMGYLQKSKNTVESK